MQQRQIGNWKFGPRAKAGIGPKYYWGRSIRRAKMWLEPKYAWGQSECGAKVVLGPNWVWAIVKWFLKWSFANLNEREIKRKKAQMKHPLVFDEVEKGSAKQN